MKYVNSGSGKIPLISLIAILSISLIVNLPGLAVSPLLGTLKQTFPNVTELESQLLVVLPNFVIIPFILWSGKLCNLNNQILILGIGLVIYILSGLMFLFADSMVELILLSCLLGIGCGLCIPLAASLIAQNFTGKARTRQLGMKSGISNFTVIFATLFVGWISAIGWHLAFLVYLVPAIPLCLMPFLTRKYIDKHKVANTAAVPAAETPAQSKQSDKTVNITTAKFPAKQTLWLLLGVIGLYVAMTYGTMVISDYLPFTMKHYSLNSAEVGVATALFFVGATASGFTLTRIIHVLKNHTTHVALAMCVIGLYLCGFVHSLTTYLLAVFIIGFGYGILQPVIYDKTAYLAPTSKDSTRYFAYTLTGNYIAIAIVPFVVDMFARICGASTLNFPYILNGSLLLAVLCLGFWKSRSFVFSMVGADAKKQSN